LPLDQERIKSRHWLRPRAPKERLNLLAPARPKLRRLGVNNLWDVARSLILSWWVWLAAALLWGWTGSWLGAILSGALAFGFYHIFPRPHPVLYALEPDFDSDSLEFRATMAGTTGMPAIGGNRVEIYNNGDEFYPAMMEAIESAQYSVTIELFIFWDGQVGRRFAEAFAEKAREGVAVKLLVDAIGSPLGDEIVRILEAGGCQLAWFHPVRWYALDRVNLRTHRKSIIVDGRVAFTGGAGLADHWLGAAANESEWRDIQVRVEGPAVAVQQSGFAQNWLHSTGELLSGHAFFPKPHSSGDVEIQTILSSPASGACAAATLHMIAIECARHNLYIANSYFIPDSRFIDMLVRARDRGVDVRVMVAGKHSDTWWARQNSLRLYGDLLRAGVEIYEYQPTMLHQKIMVVDGVWATIGTANFDSRSFALSEETNICFHDRALVNHLRSVFLADLEHCQRVDLADWGKRGLWQRSKEWLASLIQNQV
jgi:cardiolipin synthase